MKKQYPRQNPDNVSPLREGALRIVPDPIKLAFGTTVLCPQCKADPRKAHSCKVCYGNGVVPWKEVKKP